MSPGDTRPTAGSAARRSRTRSLLRPEAILAAGCLLWAGCSCKETVYRESISPDEQYTATFYESDCGATTDFESHVSLRRAKSRGLGEDVLVMDYHEDFSLTWPDGRHLLIEYHRCANDKETVKGLEDR